ncbi:MAG: response regulator [Hyphomonadaceae bacterium]|nr:response regulator [Hyphomonadaceae bacterium]
MRLLLIEDHPRLGQSLEDALRRAGYAVDRVGTVADAHVYQSSTQYNLALLDLGLPDGDGLELLRNWRRAGVSFPIIVLTARGGLNDRISGLDEGADDYLVKPFAIEEMISRCRALLRRPASVAPDLISYGEISANASSMEVYWRGQPIDLARRERRLLIALLRRAGRVCSRATLENELYDYQRETTPNALETSVSRLRGVLRALGAIEQVDTVRGVGYILRGAPP